MSDQTTDVAMAIGGLILLGFALGAALGAVVFCGMMLWRLAS